VIAVIRVEPIIMTQNLSAKTFPVERSTRYGARQPASAGPSFVTVL